MQVVNCVGDKETFRGIEFFFNLKKCGILCITRIEEEYCFSII